MDARKMAQRPSVGSGKRVTPTRSKASALYQATGNAAIASAAVPIKCRRAYFSPDGELLANPMPQNFRAAATVIERSLSAIPDSSTSQGELPQREHFGTVVPSANLVADVPGFFQLMDEVTMGCFLKGGFPQLNEAPQGFLSHTGITWTDAGWLHLWGRDFPLGAFLASRLEIQLVRAYQGRAKTSPTIGGLAGLLAQSLESIPRIQRASCIEQILVERSLERDYLKHTLAYVAAEKVDAMQCLANNFERMHMKQKPKYEEQASLSMISRVAEQQPTLLAVALVSVSLEVVPWPLEVHKVQVQPHLWAQWELSRKLEIACSEQSAKTLLQDEAEDEEDATHAGEKKVKQKSKRAKQRLRKQHAEEEQERSRRAIEEEKQREKLERIQKSNKIKQEHLVQKIVGELLDEVVNLAFRELRRRQHRAKKEKARQIRLERRASEAMRHPIAESGIKSMTFPGKPLAAIKSSRSEGFVSCESRSVGDSPDLDIRNSRSSGVNAEDSVSLDLRSFPRMKSRHHSLKSNSLKSLRSSYRSQRAFKMDGKAQSEGDWEVMSNRSFPTSLDDAALWNACGLENRFSYLFDSPPRSRQPSALASRTSVDDDIERAAACVTDDAALHDCSMDPYVVACWPGLSQALEETKSEISEWKTKAEHLEGIIAGMHASQAEAKAESTSDSPEKAMPAVEEVSAVVLTTADDDQTSPDEDKSPPLHNVTSAQPVLPIVLQEPYPEPEHEEPSGDSEHAAGNSSGGDNQSNSIPAVSMIRRMRSLPDRLEGSRSVVTSSPPPDAPGASSTDETPSEDERRIRSSTSLTLSPPLVACHPSLPKAITVSSQAESVTFPGQMARKLDRKHSLHTSFRPHQRGVTLQDNSTQTDPAITLSRMYSDMIPRHILMEISGLQQQNNILKYRLDSLATFKQSVKKVSADTASQTVPNLTFVKTLRSSSVPEITRLQRELSRLRQENVWLGAHAPGLVGLLAEPRCLDSEAGRAALDGSIQSFVCAAQQHIQLQTVHIRAAQEECQRCVRTLWPRTSVKLYGSLATGLALPTSDMDLVICVERGFPCGDPGGGGDEQTDSQPFAGGSPGARARAHVSSNWPQQLSCQLVKEKWVFTDSIKVIASAAIPVLSFVTVPDKCQSRQVGLDVSTAGIPSAQVMNPIRVDLSLEGPNHYGIRSKDVVLWVINDFPHTLEVTLVLKQWLIEQGFGTSYTGGLSSYALLLLVAGYLQHCPASNAAAALVGFLDFYGKCFDPRVYGVSVARHAFLRRKSPATWPSVRPEYVERGVVCAGLQSQGYEVQRIGGSEAHKFDPLWIEDPLNHTNNVGRNCFRVRQIQRVMARAADALVAEPSLHAILQVAPGTGYGHWGSQWKEESVHAKQALQGELYRDFAAHSPYPMPHPQDVAQSHLPQQWDSAVRYTAHRQRVTTGPSNHIPVHP
eukprot:gnl/MRDRNA2_/MRDRNA2_63875_c0_seq1.p1 gnl/MRDRNA2_/MRDRNA2_63875_c0~~gnl/MRDRNA2_/MRDRNA2_63875_c0_seq1.p1  ORF type:complete len:1463 (+),score=258.35 gnl/MRDRNA2_/MRDRNA2_63875_c0_seq1:97-4389(+)